MQFPGSDGGTGDGTEMTDEDIDLTVCPRTRVILHYFLIDRLHRHRDRLTSGHTG